MTSPAELQDMSQNTESPRLHMAPPKEKKRKAWLGPVLTFVATATPVFAWALSISGDMKVSEERLRSLEEQSKRVEIMVLQNRVMTLEIAKELAHKVDTLAKVEPAGLPGIDFAIQQANDDLDRASH